MPEERTVIIKRVSPGTFQRLWVMKSQRGHESWLGLMKEVLEDFETLGESTAKGF